MKYASRSSQDIPHEKKLSPPELTLFDKMAGIQVATLCLLTILYLKYILLLFKHLEIIKQFPWLLNIISEDISHIYLLGTMKKVLFIIFYAYSSVKIAIINKQYHRTNTIWYGIKGFIDKNIWWYNATVKKLMRDWRAKWHLWNGWFFLTNLILFLLSKYVSEIMISARFPIPTASHRGYESSYSI